MSNAPTSTEERALKLLAAGYTAETVAQTIGVTPGRISQLLGTDSFKNDLVTERYKRLSKDVKRDEELDEIEDLAVAAVKRAAGMIWDPMKALGIFKVINSARRRINPAIMENSEAGKTTVLINMPTVIMNKIKIVNNAQNQVVQVIDEATGKTQSLQTIQSGNMGKLAAPISHKQLTDILEAPNGTPLESTLTGTN